MAIVGFRQPVKQRLIILRGTPLINYDSWRWRWVLILWNYFIPFLSGDLAAAQRLYERLVASEVVTELRSLAEADPDLKHPLKNITYSAFKNLAKIVADADQAEFAAASSSSSSTPSTPTWEYENNKSAKAMELYLEASVLDESDPMLWYQMGKLAETCRIMQVMNTSAHWRMSVRVYKALFH